MSKKILNFLTIIMFLFTVIYFSLKIAYDTFEIEKADQEYADSLKEFEESNS